MVNVFSKLNTKSLKKQLEIKHIIAMGIMWCASCHNGYWVTENGNNNFILACLDQLMTSLYDWEIEISQLGDHKQVTNCNYKTKIHMEVFYFKTEMKNNIDVLLNSVIYMVNISRVLKFTPTPNISQNLGAISMFS